MDAFIFFENVFHKFDFCITLCANPFFIHFATRRMLCPPQKRCYNKQNIGKINEDLNY